MTTNLRFLTWPPNPPDQSYLASLEFAGQAGSVDGGPTLQLAKFKCSANNGVVPDTAAHL